MQIFISLKNFWGRFSGVEQKLLLLFISLLIVSSGLFAWGRSHYKTLEAKNGGTYTEGLVGQPRHINPVLAATPVDMDLSRIVYSGLYKFDTDLNLVPDLADVMPEVASNGKEYTVRLKEGLYWQDGIKITADDLVYTFQIVQNPDYQSPLRFSWSRVDVQKIDERTVKIITREASAPFVANFTLGILPKHIWQGVPAESFALSKFNLEPIGSGPFQIKEMNRGREGEIRSITLKTFDRYHAGRPYLDRVILKFYATTDELISAYQKRDIVGLGYRPFDDQLFIQPKSKLQQFSLPLPEYQAVFINRAKNPAPLEDARVRTALAKSVDKQRIIAEVYGGRSSESYGPILPGHLGYHEQIPGADMNIYDPEKSKSLLEEAGWQTDPESGFRKDKLNRVITISLATNNLPQNVRVAGHLKEMWENIGIQIILNIETVGDLDEKFIRPRNYELLLYSENVGADPDPWAYWHSSQLRDPGLNLSTFSNAQADKLLVEARTNIPADERAAKYRKFQEIFVGDAPAVFISRNIFVYNVTTDVKGINLKTVVTPSDRFANIAEWYIETKRIK
ncbi:MAG: peptide ABC transporter substrate-binding protein [Candidatus Doudnabacteria bacterium]|nr:peptide ABC transporter substrate-binding protein [bacterium]MDZ4244029.1 peptide ABC transporter substrate-binding protein [Candidatus Doudnabacteria bacterium]